MSETFNALSISASSLMVNRKWMDAVSDNIANINTVTSTTDPAFRERFIEAQAVNYGSEPGGVRVSKATFGDATGRLVYQPDHPLADADGYVRYPDIDLGDQMVQLMMAQRAYQANLSAVERTTEAYQQALQIGKG